MKDKILNTIAEELDKNKPMAETNQFLKPGWLQVFSENLPTKGKYYPGDVLIAVKGGSSKDVRAWSMIDENDLISIQEGMNSILKSNVEITSGNRFLDWRDICEEDRLPILLMIRDITFPEPENVLTSQVECQCGEGSLEVKYNHLETFQIDNKYDKYYDSKKRLYVIKTKSYGDIEIRPPSIGCSIAALEYIKRCQAKRITPDTSLVQLIPYMSIDWRNMSENFVKQLEAEMIGWGPQKTSFMFKLIQEIQEGPNMTMKGDCRNCGSEVTGPLTFRNGLKSVFDIQNIDSELL